MIAEGPFENQAGTNRSSRRAGHAEKAHGGAQIRPQHRRIPSHRRAPIMAENHRRLRAERIDEADHIASYLQRVVGCDRLRAIGLPIAAPIGATT